MFEDRTDKICSYCFSYMIKNNKWRKEPDLAKLRSNHSSCSLGERVFVLFGDNIDSNSIESLRVDSGQQWEVIKEGLF